MKIYSLANVLAFPLIIVFVIILYLSGDYTYQGISVWMIPLAIVVAIIYVMKPQIDFWWHSKNPTKLDQPIIDWLNKYSSFYQNLAEGDKNKFEDRLSIFVRSKSFEMMVGPEKQEMPEDLKAIIAHCAIQVSFGDENFLFEPFDHYILYQHPFPSPDHPYIHSYEINREDGVILWSLEQLIPGLLDQNEYNIGIHGFVEAKNIDYLPDSKDLTPQELKKIQMTLGLRDINMGVIMKTLEIDTH